jgi:hypothetical protein
LTSLIMSSCCTLRLNRRRAFSRDSPSCSRISAKQTHPQTRPVGPNSYYKDLTASQVGRVKKVAHRWDRDQKLEGKGDLVQLEAKGMSEPPLVQIEAVQAVHTQFECGCYVQEIRSAGAQFCGSLPGELVGTF